MQRVTIANLYQNVDKNGNTYLAGSLSNFTGVLIFKNSYRREEKNDPHYKMYLFRRTKNLKPVQKSEFYDIEEDNGEDFNDEVKNEDMNFENIKINKDSTQITDSDEESNNDLFYFAGLWSGKDDKGYPLMEGNFYLTKIHIEFNQAKTKSEDNNKPQYFLYFTQSYLISDEVVDINDYPQN